MIATTIAAPAPLVPLLKAYGTFEARLNAQTWFKGLVLLAVRLWIAQFFMFSGLTKIKSWPATLALFKDEYHVPVLPPDIAAVLSATAELSLPIFLVLGLFTRFAALGFFGMTLVIELFVYPGTTENYYIFLLTFVLISHGSGLFGADYWAAKSRA
jgi:putative oxidoreductase